MEPYFKSERVANFYDFTKERFDQKDGTVFGNSHTFGSNLAAVNSLSGFKNPGWRDQLKSGVNATTSMVAQNITIKNSYFYGQRIVGYNQFGSPALYTEIKDVVRGVYPYDPPLPIPPPPSDVIARVHSRCVQKFINECEAAISSLSSGQDFGELKETLHAMTNPLSSMRQLLVRTFTSLKKRRLPRMKLRDAEKVITDTYLEFTFGWNPLASDIAAAYVGFTANGNHFESVPVETSAHEDYNASVETINSPFAVGTFRTFPLTVKMNSNYTERMKGAIRTHASGDKFSEAQVLGLLPHNFIPTIWELLPYSFVVDYFSNIGAVIQGLCFPFSDLAWGCITTRSVGSVIYSPGEIDLYAGAFSATDTKIKDSGYSGGGNAKFSSTTVGRTPILPADLLAPVQFRLPLSEKPWENIGALILSNTRDLVPYLRGLKVSRALES